MDLKKIIDKIIENNNPEEMREVGDIFMSLLYDLKKTNHAWYNSIKYKMYVLGYGEHLTPELAHKWVSKMENKDGTTGEHWTYEQTEEVRKQYAPNLNGCDFYAVLNMIYSDYYNQKFSTTDYVELAKDWLTDKDIPEGKALRYYMFVA